MAQKITAFVAKSFAVADEAKIAPIIKFLASLNKLGFILQDAERSEVESVSTPVSLLFQLVILPRNPHRSCFAGTNQAWNSLVSLANNILAKDRLLLQSVSASARLKQDFRNSFLVCGL
jgi:hypothetical protein